MLEEKYENTVKAMSNEYEAKLSRMQALSVEKEKATQETHKSELEQLSYKSKMDIERSKAKYHDDLCAITSEYETKLTNLNLMIDSHRSEIDRLKKANKDLEFERNTVKQNLKSMLELQMKETMQLLGINNNNNTTNNSEASRQDLQKTKSPSFEKKAPLSSTTQSFPTSSTVFNHQSREESLNGFYESIKAKINSTLSDHTLKKEPVNSPKVDTRQGFDVPLNTSANKLTESTTLFNKPQIEKSTLASISDLISSFNHSSLASSIGNKPAPGNLSERPSATPSAVVEETRTTKPEIKDSFILNQIDLINKYYQIDNKTIAAAAAVSASGAPGENPNAHSNNHILSTTPVALSINNKSRNTSVDHSDHNSTSKPMLSHTKNDVHSKTKSSNLKSVQPEQGVVESNNTRAHDLRHFIEILLNKSPSASDNENNENENGSNEKSAAAATASQMTLTPTFNNQSYEPSTPTSKTNKM